MGESHGRWVGNARIPTFRPTLSHLRLAIEDDDARRFKLLFNRRGAAWEWDKLNEGVDSSGDTVLVALCRKGWSECVQLLQNAPNPGFHPNFVHPREKLTAVQIAAKLGKEEVTRALALDKRTDLNPPPVSGQNNRTLAHLLVLKAVELNKAGDADGAARWSRLLLDVLARRPDAASSLDLPDARGCTPLYFAVKNRLEPELCVALRRAGASLSRECDLDQVTVAALLDKAGDAEAARIRAAFAENGILDPDSVRAPVIPWLHRVDQAIRQDNYSALEELLADEKEAESNVREYIAGKTPLTLAASLKRTKMCQLLIPLGAVDRPDDLKWTPLHFAAHHGNLPLLTALLDAAAAAAPSDELVNARNCDDNTPLILILRREGGGRQADYKDCFDLLMTRSASRLDLDAQDLFGNTALHHAVYGWDKRTVMALLAAGATMWARNADGEVPLARIPTQLLWEFFDTRCMSLGELENFGREQFELELDYSFLSSGSGAGSGAGSGTPGRRLKPETSCLWWITQNPGHIEVLRHPVVKLFLHFKWQKIFRLFFAHCAFYVIYLALLFVYLIFGAFPSMLTAKGAAAAAAAAAEAGPESCFKISLVHEGNSYSLQNDACSASSAGADGSKMADGSGGVPENYLELLPWEWNVVRLLLLGLNSVILAVEMFQLLISPLRYLFGSLVNIFELAMVASVYGFLLIGNVDAGRTTGVLALLFSLSEVTRLFGQMPVISTYVKMFTTIAWNFLKFLLWYVILVLVYSLSFLLLFYPSTEFQSPFGSLLKTIAMLAGELGFENLPFDQYSVVSQFTFVTFVFFVTIVLLNLLTGLAVGETARIQDRAEVMGYVSQIRLMFYIESMLLRDPENAFGRFRVADKMARFCRSFLTLGLYRRLASGKKRTFKERERERAGTRTLIDVCPGLGWFLDRVGSSSLVFRDEEAGREDDACSSDEMRELKVVVGDGGTDRVTSVSASSVSTENAGGAGAGRRIRLMPFEDFHRRVAEPHDELALGDALAEDLVGYVQQNLVPSARGDGDESSGKDHVVLEAKLDGISEKLRQLEAMVRDMKRA